MQNIDIWKFLAGLGIFLMGLFFIEESLKNMAGGSFKRFLRKHTNNRIKAILSGTVVTAILQSSSVVSLIVLAFVGAGVMNLSNALGVIVGSNLGTTFTGWIVATLGFQLNIESFSMPFIAIGGLSLLFLKDKKKLVELGRFVMGFGLLFLGLNFMKISVEQFADNFNLDRYVQYGPYLLLIVGFVLTAIIQSSSAAMVITLSALHGGLINLEGAAGIVIGSDLGTTITVVLGSLNGTAAKKRVALSHVGFNTLTALIALIFLYPLLNLISNTFSIQDELMALVAFHSIFNVIGIIVCFPFLGLFARFLENRFQSQNSRPSLYISKVSTEVPEAAIAALKNELLHLTELLFLLHLKVLQLKTELFNFKRNSKEQESLLYDKSYDYLKIYEAIKLLESELVPYYLKIQNEKLEAEESNALNQLIRAIRYAMESAKGIKDIAHNIEGFERSANDNKIALYELLKGRLIEFYLNLYHILNQEVALTEFEFLADAAKENQQIFDHFLTEAYQQINQQNLSEMEIPTILNVNREIYNANLALIFTLKDLLLSAESANSFTLIPHGND
ncbi:MAG: Na/Pi symporter [Vicingaceae bacterium]